MTWAVLRQLFFIDDAQWSETKHPRDADGKFTSGAGGSSAKTEAPPKHSYLSTWILGDLATAKKGSLAWPAKPRNKKGLQPLLDLGLVEVKGDTASLTDLGKQHVQKHSIVSPAKKPKLEPEVKAKTDAQEQQQAIAKQFLAPPAAPPAAPAANYTPSNQAKGTLIQLTKPEGFHPALANNAFYKAGLQELEAAGWVKAEGGNFKMTPEGTAAVEAHKAKLAAQKAAGTPTPIPPPPPPPAPAPQPPVGTPQVPAGYKFSSLQKWIINDLEKAKSGSLKWPTAPRNAKAFAPLVQMGVVKVEDGKAYLVKKSEALGGAPSTPSTPSTPPSDRAKKTTTGVTLSGEPFTATLRHRADRILEPYNSPTHAATMTSNPRGALWDHYGIKQRQMLPPAQRTVTIQYQGSTYININRRLAGMPLFSGYPNSDPAVVDQQIADLKPAFDHAVCPVDIKVTRSLSASLKDIIGTGIIDEAVGGVFEHKGAVSSSRNPDISFGGNVRIKTTIPRGTPAVVMPDMGSEHEVLLPPSSMFRIDKIEKVESAKTYSSHFVVHCTYLGVKEQA